MKGTGLKKETAAALSYVLGPVTGVIFLVLEKDPFLVLVEFSGNDFIKKLPRDETARSINEIVERIQAKGAIVAVVDISAGFFMGEYRAILSKIARDKGALFVPQVLRGIITNPSMKSDFLHPNESGYRIIAGRVHKAISPYLRRVRP